jgi:formiminoglutamase
MTDLSFFFEPLQLDTQTYHHFLAKQDIVEHFIDAYFEEFPNWEAAELVVFGLNEERGGLGVHGCSDAADRIRQYFYRLGLPSKPFPVADLGNLVPKLNLEDYYYTLEYVVQALLREGKAVLVLGGTQDLTYPIFRAFEKMERMVEYVSIDHSPDLFDSQVSVNNCSYNHKILLHEPNYLYHFSVLGVQQYFITEEERHAMREMGFEMVRIGDLRKDIRMAEAYLRQASLVSFDASVIRQSDAPGASNPSPGGLTMEEACQVARFSGMSYLNQCFFVSEYNPLLDQRDLTAHSLALVIWHYVQGFFNRIKDEPRPDRSNMQLYRVAITGPLKELLFYKHEGTQRWWVEIPSPKSLSSRKGFTHLAPCAESDYALALADEIPERWWIMYNKFH